MHFFYFLSFTKEDLLLLLIFTTSICLALLCAKGDTKKVNLGDLAHRTVSGALGKLLRKSGFITKTLLLH